MVGNMGCFHVDGTRTVTHFASVITLTAQPVNHAISEFFIAVLINFDLLGMKGGPAVA
jgi:hypothetical protein